MMMMLAAGAHADPASEAAMARLERYGPHAATYTKVSTGERALEIRYHSPLEVSLSVISPEGAYALSVDQDHIRFKADAVCATLPVEPMLDAVELIGLGEDTGAGFSALLDYRLRPDGQVNMSVGFTRTTQPIPLAWLADLDAPGGSLSTGDKMWTVELEGTRWSVSQKTGVLQEMSAGPNGLALETLKKLPAGPLPPICTGATDPLLVSQFTSQYLLPAYLDIVPEVLDGWSGLSAAEQARIVGRQQQFWERYFTAELPSWVASLSEGPLVGDVVLKMSDPASFAQFVETLPAEERPSAVLHWQQYWYTEAGNTVLAQHVQPFHEYVLGQLSAHGDPAIREAVINGPLPAGAVAAAEEALRPLLTLAVERGASGLKPPP